MLRRLVLICTVCFLVCLLTACGSAGDTDGRLIYMSPSASQQSGFSTSSKAKRGSSSKSASSKPKAGRSSSKFYSSRSGSSSESSKKSDSPAKGGDAPANSGTSVPSQAPSPTRPTAADAAALYNGAVAKNAALSGGLQFSFVDSDSLNGARVGGIVKFNNNINDPQFILSITSPANSACVICRRSGGSKLLLYSNSSFTEINPFELGDTPQFTMILNPPVDPSRLTSWDLTYSGTDRKLNFSFTPDSAEYPALCKIFSVSGQLTSAQFDCVISPSGYMTSLRQVFSLSSGQLLELDKSCVNLGGLVDTINP